MKPQWAVEEEEEFKRREAEEAAKPKEEQEWYQKWLRRQENRPKRWMGPIWQDDGEAIDPNEKRRDPHDGEYLTFAEIGARYAKDFKEEEIESYWRTEMKPEWVVKEEEDRKRWEQEERAKPKEEQEWYQKWLRKQENRPKLWITDFKDDAPIDPDEKRRNP